MGTQRVAAEPDGLAVGDSGLSQPGVQMGAATRDGGVHGSGLGEAIVLMGLNCRSRGR